MIGELINDKYQIESVFSESYMYEIFTAKEAATGQTVVLKLMKEEMAVNTERVKLFSEEIKNFASLSHPNIAEVLDLDVFEGRPYVVSPLVDGKELNFVMKDEVLSLSDSIKVIQDLAAVLQYASEHKIENRNINLSNVIRKKDGHITVLSFTLPRLRLVKTTASKRNENASIQADFYFLGTALYELLAGKSPIRKIGGLHELWDMNLERDLRIRHPELEPNQQRKIVEFIRKTLTREMDYRFKDYEDFSKGLSELSGNIRQANIRKKQSRQMSMASHIVDVLNNKINDTNSIASDYSVISQKAANKPLAAAASLNNAKNIDNQKKGFAESCVEGNLALSTENNEFSTAQANKKYPQLRLVKSANKTVKSQKEQSKDWMEEHNIFKNPVVIIGMALIVMVLLILFW